MSFDCLCLSVCSNNIPPKGVHHCFPFVFFSFFCLRQPCSIWMPWPDTWLTAFGGEPCPQHVPCSVQGHWGRAVTFLLSLCVHLQQGDPGPPGWEHWGRWAHGAAAPRHQRHQAQTTFQILPGGPGEEHTAAPLTHPNWAFLTTFWLQGSIDESLSYF